MTPRVTFETAGEAGYLDYDIPVAARTYGPVAYSSIQQALDNGIMPHLADRSADAVIPGTNTPVHVLWPSSKPDDWDMESQHRAMVDGQFLWMPERTKPYPIDSSQGFVAADVVSYRDTFASANGRPESIPINGKWYGKTARTWFAMTRMRRGLAGLGPGTRVEPSASSFTRFPQSYDSHTAAYYTNTAGVESKITGNQEKLIDHSPNGFVGTTKVYGVNADPYVGNFVLGSRDFGRFDATLWNGNKINATVAHHGIVADHAIWQNMFFDSCWRGHGYSPNSETGAFGVGGWHDILNSTIDGTYAGKTSLLMSNHVTDGAHIGGLRVQNIVNGGLVRWQCSGKQLWEDVWLPSNGNINIEDNDPGFDLTWVGGSIGGGGYNVNLRSPRGSSKLTFQDVALVGGPTPGTLVFNVWASGSEAKLQKAADLKYLDKAGNPLPMRVAGIGAA